MKEILRLFPEETKRLLAIKIGKRWDKLEEIRCRLHQPLELIFEEKVEWLAEILPDRNMGIFLINQLSEYSLYRMENELREGYITIEGGHRVGIAGKVNTIGGAVKAIQNITFFNIRIAKEKVGVAEPLMPYIFGSRYVNTLIVGPPQSGKTTLIRDMVRIISTGWKSSFGKKVAVIDERSEIGACMEGVPQHDLGLRTDVMDGCPKAEGMTMMIRSMSPEVLVADEIGGREDMEALLQAIHSGVTIICSIHGQSLEDIKVRPYIQDIYEAGIFMRFVVLGKRVNGHQTIEVFDQYGRLMKVAGDR